MHIASSPGQGILCGHLTSLGILEHSLELLGEHSGRAFVLDILADIHLRSFHQGVKVKYCSMETRDLLSDSTSKIKSSSVKTPSSKRIIQISLISRNEVVLVNKTCGDQLYIAFA